MSENETETSPKLLTVELAIAVPTATTQEIFPIKGQRSVTVMASPANTSDIYISASANSTRPWPIVPGSVISVLTSDSLYLSASTPNQIAHVWQGDGIAVGSGSGIVQGLGTSGSPSGGVLTVQGSGPSGALSVGGSAVIMEAYVNAYSTSAQPLRTPAIFKTVAAVAVTAGTPVAIWTPATGKTVRLMGWDLSLSVAGGIIFKQGTTPGGSTEVIRTSSNGANVSHPSAPGMGNGVLLSAANNILYADVTASGTISGHVFGTEE